MIFWVIFNVLYFWVADLHPRSRIFLGCIVDFQQGLFSSADGTSANQRGERAVHVLKILGGCRFSLTAPPSSCSPRTGYIQRRFSAASFWYPHFEQSVTAFASLSPLPPFISLRSLRLKSLADFVRDPVRFPTTSFWFAQFKRLGSPSANCVITFASLTPTG